jgi:hypothetical protein
MPIDRFAVAWVDGKPFVATNDRKLYGEYWDDREVFERVNKEANEILRRLSNKEIGPWMLHLLSDENPEDYKKQNP